ncbi:exonuclease domain-containing protein [Anaerotignum faecicola]|nr:exonuclease domain-containing protein [Anaerotignum faecicola]
MNYIVLDLEFNQPYNFKNGKRTVLEPKVPFEIIQFGAVKLDNNFNITDKFDYFVKPQIYSRLHPIVEKITGITIDKLENGNSFLTAFEKFTAFAGSESVLCSWGADDIKSLYRNIIYYKCNQEKITKNYINIQEIATKKLNFESGNSIGLKAAVELLEIPQEIPFHDALNDAYYTALVFKKIIPETFDIKTLSLSELEPKKSGQSKTNTKALLNYFEKSLERKLTSEETAIIKTAYKLGQKRSYDAKNKKTIL